MNSQKTPPKMAATPLLLPTIEEHPAADIVLYDGRCVFCTTSVSRLHGLDGRNRLAFLSLHDPLVAQRFPDLSHEQLMEQMWVVPHADPNQRFGGATAIRYLSRRLPKLWIIAPLMHVPFSLPLWQYLYRQVAQRRYQIANKNGEGCEGDTCDLHHRK